MANIDDGALVLASCERLHREAYLLLPMFRVQLGRRTDLRLPLREEHLALALSLVLKYLRAPEAGATRLAELGTTLVDAGLWPADLEVAERALLATLGSLEREAWTSTVSAAWTRTLTAMRSACVRGMLSGLRMRVAG